MRIFFKVVLFMTVFCLSGYSALFALDTSTHEKINEFIATESLNGFDLDRYLKEHLGFSKGADEEIILENDNFSPEEGYEVWRWMASGGKWEDNPPSPAFQCPGIIRAFNHFHNPLTDEGLSVLWKGGGLRKHHVGGFGTDDLET